MRFIIFITLSIAYFLVEAQQLQQAYVEAMQQYQAGDYQQFYKKILHAHAIHPYHQGILYQSGIAAALLSKKAEAVDFLQKAILIQTDFPLLIPDLETLRGYPPFEKIKDYQKSLIQTIIQSDTAFMVPSKEHLESLTAITSNQFYFTSIHHRNLYFFQNHSTQAFFDTTPQLLGSSFGIVADKAKKLLWVSTSSPPQMMNNQERVPSGILKIDLKTRKIIKKFTPKDNNLNYMLGALTMGEDGDIYASDSENNFIFKVNEKEGVLEQFYSNEKFWNLQGVALSPDESYLFIADYVSGIYQLNLETRALKKIETQQPISLKGIDGIQYYQHSLIAIQNGTTPKRVVRLFLNEPLDQITSFSIIDQNHPGATEPTSGFILDNEFYYLANSPWDAYDESFHFQEEKVSPTLILKVQLE